MVSDQKRDKFIGALKILGGSSGNKSLRIELGWSEATYDKVKEDLIKSKTIEKGRGGGGSVIISKKILRKPILSVQNKREKKSKSASKNINGTIKKSKKSDNQSPFIFTVNDHETTLQPGYKDALLKEEREKSLLLKEEVRSKDEKINELSEKVEKLKNQLRDKSPERSVTNEYHRMKESLKAERLGRVKDQARIRELEAPKVVAETDKTESKDQKRKLKDAVIRYKAENESLKDQNLRLTADNESLKIENLRLNSELKRMEDKGDGEI